MIIELIRHADPDYAVDSLTARGIIEAEALQQHFKNKTVDQLFCSPLGRARKTAEFIEKACNRKATVLDWTRELEPFRLSGSQEVHWNIPGEDVRSSEYLSSPQQWKAISQFASFELDDQINTMIAASDQFLSEQGFVREEHVYRITRPNRKKLVLVCHGGFGLTWLAHLLAIPYPLMWTGFFLRTSSVSTILFEERSKDIAVPRCMGLSDCSHLAAANLEPTPRGLTANTD